MLVSLEGGSRGAVRRGAISAEDPRLVGGNLESRPLLGPFGYLCGDLVREESKLQLSVDYQLLNRIMHE